jgi:hypothetical protein
MRIRLLVLLPFLFLAPVVAAEAAPIAVGDTVTLTDGPGTTGGGEFNMFVNGSAQSFITFCLQRTQYIGFNQQFRVGGVTNYADDAGGNDPISLQTQWLYSNVRAGTLGGYAHNNAMADLLQTAIWYFENEITLSTSAKNANSFISMADTAVTNGFKGASNVRVLNLFYMNGAQAQDQLALQVPGPAALTLIVPAVAALAFMRRRRVFPQA